MWVRWSGSVKTTWLLVYTYLHHEYVFAVVVVSVIIVLKDFKLEGPVSSACILWGSSGLSRFAVRVYVCVCVLFLNNFARLLARKVVWQLTKSFQLNGKTKIKYQQHIQPKVAAATLLPPHKQIAVQSKLNWSQNYKYILWSRWEQKKARVPHNYW